MKLIFLHGAPANDGKLMVTKALLKTLPARLLDNHAAIDAARTDFDFGPSRLSGLVDTIRESILQAPIENDVPLVIVALCYSDPEVAVSLIN